ncbi:hypothetical protein [Pseudomonas sp. SO81]|uniref:hypothetical protein n=1 Tax=Pseudomonas sp. SO81 TaxID=2983246 RepID=UPI0025A397F9|nr:hypothetical protein [Pseudomonas sp. SO81]WJN61371.1 hypothetical protein OH686_21720 [Pseudomonas sp. SO81]
MKHLLHLVVENGGAHWLLVFDPTTATAIHSQPLALDALSALVQDDLDALLASLPPLTDDRPAPGGNTSMMIIGRDDQERVLFACAAAASSWDGTENMDGYGYWRSARYRFRIVEVTSSGVVPLVEFNRTSLQKESSWLGGGLFDCFDGAAYFFCQPEVADNSTTEQVVKLAQSGASTVTTWAGFGFQTDAFFTTEAELLVAIAEQSE